LFEADRNVPLKITNESKDLQWVMLDQVEQLTREESVLRMVRKTQRTIELWERTHSRS
jgi:hypothetical protein